MRFTLALGVLVWGLGCKPDDPLRSSDVREARVLAVRAEPPEAKPGEAISFSALAVGAAGEDLSSGLVWAFCNARKPLDELGPVNPACVRGGAEALLAMGTGSTVEGTIPPIACRQFGPEIPVAQAGEPPGRPVDPDPSGGYYQPVTVRLAEGDVSLGSVRLLCGLAGASPEQTALFGRDYRPNTNPVVRLSRATLTSGETIVLRAAWEGTENYVALDPSTRTVEIRREAMRVSWFATGGSFAEDRTGRAADDMNAWSENAFTAPDAPGTVQVWVVIRDDRGGIGWTGAELEVR